jgi:MOSC domain-containing protein YiiM
LTAATDLKALRLRGLFMKVIEGGEVATGDEIEILTRPG